MASLDRTFMNAILQNVGHEVAGQPLALLSAAAAEATSPEAFPTATAPGPVELTPGGPVICSTATLPAIQPEMVVNTRLPASSASQAAAAAPPQSVAATPESVAAPNASAATFCPSGTSPPACSANASASGTATRGTATSPLTLAAAVPAAAAVHPTLAARPASAATVRTSSIVPRRGGGKRSQGSTAGAPTSGAATCGAAAGLPNVASTTPASPSTPPASAASPPAPAVAVTTPYAIYPASAVPPASLRARRTSGTASKGKCGRPSKKSAAGRSRDSTGGASNVAAGLNRNLPNAVQDEEEIEEHRRRRRLHAAEAEKQAEQLLAKSPPAAMSRSARKHVAVTAAGPAPIAPPGAIEPAFEFAPLPSEADLTSNEDIFVSSFMLKVVANWPQTTATFKRRKMNSRADDCPGVVVGAEIGTNASLKTWAARIRVACALADFVGRTVYWHPVDPRPSDAERDRGVRKFFCCLSPFTKKVIVSFLNCRKKGLAVAGGGKRLSAVSLKDFTNALTFMFGEAKMDGPSGDLDLFVDCADRTASWRAKGDADQKAEKLFREDPGVFVGNPMTTTDLKNWRSATYKQARLDGEQSKSAAAVTPELMRSL